MTRLHREAFLAGILVLAALAGCVQDPAPQPDAVPSDATQSTVVGAGAQDDASGTGSQDSEAFFHHPGGVPLTQEEVDALPEARQNASALLRYTGGASWEPTIGVTPDGSVFVSALGYRSGVSYPDTRLGPATLRSLDEGRNWTDVSPSTGAEPALPGVEKVRVPPVSFDPFLHVDPGTGRVFASWNIQPSCTWLQWTDDGGQSWSHNPVGCGTPSSQDHQTLVTADPRSLETLTYPNLLYYCAGGSEVTCAVSPDGGRTFGPSQTVDLCGGLTGHLAAGPEGRAYLGTGHCGPAQVAVTGDDGLSWSVSTVSSEAGVLGHEVALAVDGAGTVYALWTDDRTLSPVLTLSEDRGRTWTEPVAVGPPGLEAALLPALAAGGPGRIALTYVGTTNLTSATDEGLDAETWNAYLAVVHGATGPDPVIATHRLNAPDEPFQRGECQTAPNRCAGIGDFLGIVVDQAGRPWAALADGCMEEVCSQTIEGAGVVAAIDRGASLRDGGRLDGLTSSTSPGE